MVNVTIRLLIVRRLCSDDQVYMGDHELCKQYVLSDVGNIFYGNEHQISARPWNYGQVLGLYCVQQSLYT